MTNQEPVVVGVDDTTSARDAALWGADLAALWHSPLVLSHAVNAAGTISPGEVPAWLRELVTAAEQAGASPTTVDIRYGEVAQQLLGRTTDAEALLLGSYGGEGWSGMLAGTHALPLVASCRCPLIVVRGHSPGIPPPRSGPVVVGVDGSATSDAALAFGARLATVGEHRKLVAVHTWSELVRDLHGHAHKLAEDPTDLLADKLRPIRAGYPELIVEHHMVRNTPLRALLDHAEKAWLLVVGQRRTKAGGGSLVGSTSRGLIEFAPCPVAVIPAATAS